IFISLLGWRLLPKRTSAGTAEATFNLDDYITEAEVPENSKANGASIEELNTMTEADFQVLGIVRNNIRIHIPRPEERLQKGDILILETDASELTEFVKDTGVRLVGDKKIYKTAKGSENIAIMEAIVMADSQLITHTASGLRLRSRHGINLLAVARREQKIHRRLDRVIFRSGDVLLLQGQENTLNDKITAFGCLPLASRELRIGYRSRITLALGIFGASILLVVSGMLPVQVAFGMAAVAMVLAGLLPLKDVYTSVNWPVIVLLGAMIPVGVAMETSGGAGEIAGVILNLGNNLPGWAILMILMASTMLLSDIINNAATVVLMAPIAISVAHGLGYSVDPFLMSVAIGGSCAFMTPIGHQSNTLVMGPGGYKFTDYWRMGLPMDVIILAIGIPLIMMVWPL
ncbi:MAG: SLC13 family permease, partial [Bacteroidales bacterium]